ncbi:NlpC/P60 family protein [Brevibacillus sp. B_LB10_24]|uniref:C40 family peptidase n=1 Tax=Brevibacillus sp. B_LB10_24 TaxID=3380645 RepID=UPI0038BC3FE7
MKKISKWTVGVLLLAFVLSLLPVLSFAAEKPKEPQFRVGDTAYVDVAAASLWTEKGMSKTREVDIPALTNPVDLWKWTRSMTLAQKLQLTSADMLETQALYGARVVIMEERGDWIKVAAEGQPTPKSTLGYPGWVPKVQLTDNHRLDEFSDRPFAIVTSPTAWLYDGNAMNHKFMEVSYNTRLPVQKEMGDKVMLITPNSGNKWVSKADVAIYQSESDIPAPTGADLVNTAKKFLGLPYLWAGTSGFGFDCSGFTHTVFKSHGITIPRDSGPQSKAGTPVSKEELQPGDLLFFAYNNGKGSVHHVSMYIGDGKMIHSPNASRTVEIVSIDEPAYAVEFAGARRYLP